MAEATVQRYNTGLHHLLSVSNVKAIGELHNTRALFSIRSSTLPHISKYTFKTRADKSNTRLKQVAACWAGVHDVLMFVVKPIYCYTAIIGIWYRYN